MESLLITPVVILALLASLHASADFEKGMAAYDAEDYATALQELKKAAEQGHAKAQFNLAQIYSNVVGRGVPQDDKEAVKWYRLGAEQGYASAQNNLGFMYGTGTGVPQDNVYSHMWFNNAAYEGHKNAKKNRDIIAEQMTPSQIAEAQKLARECVAKEYKGC